MLFAIYYLHSTYFVAIKYLITCQYVIVLYTHCMYSYVYPKMRLYKREFDLRI